MSEADLEFIDKEKKKYISLKEAKELSAKINRLLELVKAAYFEGAAVPRYESPEAEWPKSDSYRALKGEGK